MKRFDAAFYIALLWLFASLTLPFFLPKPLPVFFVTLSLIASFIAVMALGRACIKER